MPPEARLGGAPRLQDLHEPTARLDLAPRHVLQQSRTRGWRDRLRGLLGLGGGAVLVHVAFASAFFFLLSFRDAEAPREVETPVEIVVEPAKPAAASEAPKSSGVSGGGPEVNPESPAGGPPPGGPPKGKAPPRDPKLTGELSTPPPAPPPPPPTPKVPGKPGPDAAPPAPAGEVAPPKLLAPPPDAAKAASQREENKPANLVPDEHQRDQAIREAEPVAISRVLTTGDRRAETSVPTPVKPPVAKADKPSPPIPARTPSAAEKLAAALPMDTAAMPMSFRSVLAGNAAAQINAAYAGVIQGRIQQAQAELGEAAYAQRLKGNVAVAFTVDDAGHLSGLTVVQSSGDARLDALALGTIERAAPFPPPPPEADHTFKKAFLIGD